MSDTYDVKLSFGEICIIIDALQYYPCVSLMEKDCEENYRNLALSQLHLVVSEIYDNRAIK